MNDPGHNSAAQLLQELQIKNWAIESSINAIAFSDLDGTLNYINPAFLKLWRYSSAAEVLGRPVVEFWSMPEKVKKVRSFRVLRGYPQSVVVPMMYI